MSVYHATRSSELIPCLQSLCDQQLPATQIVLVRDGPVQPEVEQCIDSFSTYLPFEHIFFPENRGLGLALQDGLHACANEIVARVDSDDSSVPERFSLQIQYLQEHAHISVVGSWMNEHYRSSITIRKTPTDPQDIMRYARQRNPINHPTAMFRKSHVLESGGYKSCLFFEDYFLWARMLSMGYQLANLPIALVETEIDSTYFERRGGITYIRHELNILKELRELKFFSTTDMAWFILARLPIRLMPVTFRKILYLTLLRET